MVSNSYARQFIINESKATLEGLWSILPSFWVSKPENVKKAEQKIFQLKNAINLGFKTPNTLITSRENELKKFNNK